MFCKPHPTALGEWIMTASDSLRFVDADGHVLEHPSEMMQHAPRADAERIWHVERDADGSEWVIMDGRRGPANPMAMAGAAGMNDEDRQRALAGELKYTEVCPAAYNADARLIDMDSDGIDVSVLYPTQM